ncbi:hypothetical protein THAOC_36687, partial [Thalassiosira oceanica]
GQAAPEVRDGEARDLSRFVGKVDKFDPYGLVDAVEDSDLLPSVRQGGLDYAPLAVRYLHESSRQAAAAQPMPSAAALPVLGRDSAASRRKNGVCSLFRLGVVSFNPAAPPLTKAREQVGLLHCEQSNSRCCSPESARINSREVSCLCCKAHRRVKMFTQTLVLVTTNTNCPPFSPSICIRLKLLGAGRPKSKAWLADGSFGGRIFSLGLSPDGMMFLRRATCPEGQCIAPIFEEYSLSVEGGANTKIPRMVQAQICSSEQPLLITAASGSRRSGLMTFFYWAGRHYL